MLFNTLPQNLVFFKRFYLFTFREGKGGEKDREREREGEEHQSVIASHVSPAGNWAETQACALTGNRT